MLAAAAAAMARISVACDIDLVLTPPPRSPARCYFCVHPSATFVLFRASLTIHTASQKKKQHRRSISAVEVFKNVGF